MAEIDTQNHLHDLISDLASERSLRVQRVALLKKRIDALGSGLDAAENLKEIESYLSSVTIQASEDLKNVESKPLEPRFVLCNNKKIALLQDEISCLDSELYALENKERFLRGRYIRKMIELNNKEREFEKTFGLSLVTDGGIGETATFVKLSEDQRTTMEIVCDIKNLMHEEHQLTKKFLDYQQKTKNLEENLKENHDVLVDEIFNLQIELGNEKRLHANLQKMLVDEKRLNANLHEMLIDDKSNMERAIRGLETETEYMKGRFTALDIENKALDEENKALMSKVAYLEGIEKEAKDDRKSWNEERETLMRDKHSNQEKMKLLGGARDNILPDSCLKKFLDWLPLCMISMVAPKGQITGEELGVFMGALVTITAYIVSYSNEFIKVTALGAFAALLGIFIGKIFNNIVTFISMDNTAGFCTSMKKAASSLMWIVLGGGIPLAFGGFIHPWTIRIIITSLVVLVVKSAFAVVWCKSYGVPWWKAGLIVSFGVVGIGLAAGIPHVLKKIG